MNIVVTHGDILDIPADTLVCSANVGLRLTGGVGGAIRIKFGSAVADQVQRELNQYLHSRGIANAKPTDVIPTSGGGSHFKSILHAVAIDGTYDSSIIILRETLRRALAAATGPHVAVTALATGYGRMTINQFAQAIAPLLQNEIPGIQTVTICLRHADAADELRESLRPQNR